MPADAVRAKLRDVFPDAFNALEALLTERELRIATAVESMAPPGMRCSETLKGWICTRFADHDGAHVAHGTTGQAVRCWKADDDQAAEPELAAAIAATDAALERLVAG